MLTTTASAKSAKYFFITVALILFSTGVCLAQEETASTDGPVDSTVPYIHVAQARPPALADPSQSQPNVPAPQSDMQKSILVPSGTRIPMVVSQALRVKSARKGDPVYLQIAFPVAVDGQVVIPPGTYVQGVIETITRRDQRHGIIEFQMSSGRLIFNNGYTVPISGMSYVVSTLAGVSQPYQHPGNGSPVPVMAATAPPPTLPPLPSLGNGPRNAIIAVGVVSVVGVVVLAVLSHSHVSDTSVQPGTAMEMVLQEPVYLDRDQVTRAVQQYSQHVQGVPPVQPQPAQPAQPKGQEMCYTAGDPGTPDTVIPGTPGTPGTPPSGNYPGTPATPGTPDTVIPGRPATPPQAYPCPK